MLTGEIIALSGLLGLAVIEDVKSHSISNQLCVTVLVTGLLFALWEGAPMGLAERLGGIAIGFLALLPFYAMSAMGAGDVKLMAAVGSYLGMATLNAVLLTLIVGGGLALTVYLIDRYLPVPGSLANALIVRQSGRLRFPYALAIAAGTAGALWIEVM